MKVGITPWSFSLRGGRSFCVHLRIKSLQQWLFFILLLAALHTSVPVSPAGSSTWEASGTGGREQGLRYTCCAVGMSCLHRLQGGKFS